MFEKYYDFFDNRYKVNVNSDDKLSHEIKYCLELEQMATELLQIQKYMQVMMTYYCVKYSIKIVRLYPKEIEYKIYTDEDLFQDSINRKETQKMAFLLKPRNHKKEKDQLITQKDKKRPVLKDYQDFIDLLKNREQTGKIRNMMTELKTDMITAKNGIDRPIVFKHVGEESCEPDWFSVNITTQYELALLLKMKYGPNLDKWLNCILLDLENTLKRVKLTDIQQKVLDLFRSDFGTLEEMSEIVGIRFDTFHEYLEDIYDKILKQIKIDYQEWIDLEYVRGVYKKCRKCGQVKLNKYFAYHKANKDKLQSYCQLCKNNKPPLN